MERRSKTKKNCQDSRGPGVDLNEAPKEHKSGALPLQPTFLATSRLCVHIMEIVLTSNRAGQNNSNKTALLRVHEKSTDGKECKCDGHNEIICNKCG
jgi:hypothetical protein